MIARALALALVVSLAASGCSGPVVSGQIGGDLQIITSAVYKQSLDNYIIPKMMERYGVRVVASQALSAEALTRAAAQKDNPSISVFMLDQGPWLQGQEAGLWATLDEHEIPNLKDIPAQWKSTGGTAMMLVMLGLLYNPSAISAAGLKPLSSINDIWAPSYRDRVSIQQFTSTFAFALLAYVNKLEGGTDSNYDPGFAKLQKLAPNIRTFSGPAAQLIQLFQQGEIWAAWGAHFTAIQAKAAGASVEWVAPSEGAMAYAHYAAIAKNAPNRAAADKLIDMLLSPDFQKVMAETDFMGPVNPKTKLTDEFKKTFPVTQEAVAKAVQIPWDSYNRLRVTLNDRWQRELQPQR